MPTCLGVWNHIHGTFVFTFMCRYFLSVFCTWFQIFQSNINNFNIVVWFQVFLSNTNNYISKVEDLNWGYPKGSLFNSDYTEV